MIHHLDRFGDPIGTLFGRSPANHLVLHRTLLQSMPREWQARFAALVVELERAFAHVDQADGYQVTPVAKVEVGEMSDDELAAAGLTCVSDCDCVLAETIPGGQWLHIPPTCEHVDRYFDASGRPVPADAVVELPLPEDPVPDARRGRTRLEPYGVSGVAA